MKSAEWEDDNLIVESDDVKDTEMDELRSSHRRHGFSVFKAGIIS